MSDCHRGDGSLGDDFSDNQHLFFAALNYYYQYGFTYIELGDGDELWENRNINTIIDIHSDAFWLMSKFYKENRLYMIYGNHDLIKRDPKYSQTKCASFFCDSENTDLPLFPGIKMHEGILLRDRNSGNQIFLTHGHQADLLNSTFWRLSRFLVRYVWRPLQLIGVRDPTSASKNNKVKNNIERRLINWSNENKQMIICGHTHRPVFPEVGEHLYFNDGSCVHPRCITAIEIYNGMITLVKWAIMTTPERFLYVGREELEGPIRLSEYFRTIKNK
ncbi:MAG: serine/threonine protein phosphatase [Clostridiales bacterium]|nr:serine/threonine protein phosphatase [Clostridiales bacterium]